MQTLSKTRESFRHEWTEEISQQLLQVVEKYRNVHGVVLWKQLVENEPAFADWTPDALRASYRNIAGTVPNTAIEEKKVLRTRLVELLPEYYSEQRRILWQPLFEEHPTEFGGKSIEFLRNLLGKLSEEEEAVAAAKHKERWSDILTRLNAAIDATRGPSGGVQWDAAVESDEVLRRVGLSALKNFYRHAK